MARLAIAVVLAMLPIPALAAGGWDDVPWQYALYMWFAAYLVIAVPAAGVGYVLGSFLRLPASIWVLAVLAVVPIAWFWVSRGFERTTELASLSFVMLLILSPMIYLGWRFGRKDAARNMARKSLLANGN
jgi:hypothetical protein